MKHLIIALLILLIGCQNKPEIDSLVYGQFLLLDKENTQLIEDIYVKTLANPTKYELLFENVFPLIDKGQLIENEILTKNKISQFVYDNCSDYLSSLIDIINDQDSKQFISKHKEDWIKHLKSRSEITPKRRTLLLSQLKAIENFSLRTIISQYRINDYSFNRLYPIVIENKKTLNRGEDYTANIVIAGTDTTMLPFIEINGKEIPINEKGQGDLKIQTNKVGTYVWTGVVKIRNDNTGLIYGFPIEGQYKVK